ncbi:endoribonuclease L-PSP [Modicisalibacter muralis]|uniref:Endoribonuclease L-PSP n=1 Tax=Modicisalibacter muralis TaxID=119000 RepID=A0A1G9G9K0_9GAMM|nr:RidA family protein [Halomonas muralis]SDK97302.1 endoribonuclease L-PSP [Halomonas muralis]
MQRSVISSPNAPRAIGPYSQAIRCGTTLYVSGQLPLAPESMTLVEGFEAQAEQVFRNLSAVLAEAGMDGRNVAKLTIYLADLDNFAELNAIMERHFVAPYPARAAIEVSRLPKSAMIEIEAVAVEISHV